MTTQQSPSSEQPTDTTPGMTSTPNPELSVAPSSAPPPTAPWLSDPGRAWNVLTGGFIFFVASIIGRFLLGEQIAFFYELGLFYLIVIGTLGPAFIRARRAALRTILDRHVSGDKDFETVYANFVTRLEQGWRPIAAGIGTGLFFLVFRWQISWSLLPYQSDVTRLLVTVFGAIACGLFVRALWLLLGFGVLVSGMSKRFEEQGARLFSLELLERAGAGFARTALGASFLSLGLFWLAISSRSLIMDRPGSLAETLPSMLAVFLLALIVPLAYLVVSIWRLHRIMVQRKDDIKRLFADEHATVERRFLEQPNREMAQKYLEGRDVIQEIDNLPECSFRFEMMAKLVTLVAIPALLFIFKEIVVDIAVELLKNR